MHPAKAARWWPAAIAALFVDVFLEAHKRAPEQIILDLDATDDPLHGHREGRFFHGYGACPRAGEAGPGGLFCYLPLYAFCGRHLLAAKLRRSNIDASPGAVEEMARIVARIRRRWPRVRILLRADSGFARLDRRGVATRWFRCADRVSALQREGTANAL